MCAALVMVATFGFSAATASASTTSSTAAYYGSVSKVHAVWYDNNGRHLINQSNYDTRNGGSTYRMLENVKVEVWSGGKYFVLDPYNAWLPSGNWTIRFTDHVYRYYNGAWHQVATVTSKVYR